MVSKKKILENLEKSSLEFLESGNEDYLNSVIEENGGDVAEIEEKGEALYKRLSFINKASSTKEKNDELLLTVIHRFKDGLDRNQDKPIATLKKLILEKPQLMRARNLDKLTEDDIRELIKGHNLVELLNSIIDK